MADIVWDDPFDGPRTGEFARFHRPLRLADVPDDDAPWWSSGHGGSDSYYPRLALFALTFDGYAAVANRDSVGEIHRQVLEDWKKTGDLSDFGLIELRIALFFVQMRNIHVGDDPTGDWDALARAIVAEIRRRVAVHEAGQERDQASGPTMSELWERLSDIGCSEASIRQLEGILSDAARMSIGTATTPAFADHRLAVLDHFDLLQWPRPVDLAEAESITAIYGLPAMDFSPEHRFAMDRLWELSAYLERGRREAVLEVEGLVLDALRGDDPFDVKSQVVLAARWSIIADLAAVPLIEWRTDNTSIDIRGYPTNPMEPLVRVFTDGYAIDWRNWRFTNNNAEDLGSLPDVPQIKKQFGEGVGGPSRLAVLAWTIFLPITIFALIPIPSAPGSTHNLGMALLGGIAYLTLPAFIGGLLTATWWLAALSAYLFAGQLVVGRYLSSKGALR